MDRWGRHREDRLGSGELGVLRTTEQSDELAHELMETAHERLKHRKKGACVTIEITESSRHIHQQEFGLSCLGLALRYGVQLTLQRGNQLTFTKL